MKYSIGVDLGGTNIAVGIVDDNNQIIDGNTDYRDVLDQYLDLVMDLLENGGDIPPELLQFIEDYFGGL